MKLGVHAITMDMFLLTTNTILQREARPDRSKNGDTVDGDAPSHRSAQPCCFPTWEPREACRENTRLPSLML